LLLSSAAETQRKRKRSFQEEREEDITRLDTERHWGKNIKKRKTEKKLKTMKTFQ
jgi:hypothetical protein